MAMHELDSPSRQWTKAELDEKWRNQKRLRAPPAVGALSIRAGQRFVRLEAGGPRSADLKLGGATTALLVYAESPPASDPSVSVNPELVAIHLLSWDDEGRPTDTAPTHYRLGSGRSLVLFPPRAPQGQPSCSVLAELRDGASRRITEIAARRLAGTLPPDFCLAELRPADLRAWPVWRSLLCGFGLVPSFVAAAIALVLTLVGSSPSALAFGTASGALVALTGTLICGATVSVVAASLGGIPIRQLEAPLVLAVLRKIEARGSLETAKRVRQRMSAVFVHAVSEGI